MAADASFDSYAGTAAQNYEHFVPLTPALRAADLVQAAALRPGEADVACVTGVVTRLAAAPGRSPIRSLSNARRQRGLGRG